jgi:DNA ligase (NAD+)
MSERNPYLENAPEEFEPVDQLGEEEAEQEVARLREALNYHDKKYYAEADPVISDAAYDRLFNRLEEFEAEFPELEGANSPTKRVGAPPVDELETVEHVRPMLSLDSTLEEDEIRDFDRYLGDQLGHHDFTYWSELKFDGFSVELVYEDGELDYGATRGDGYEGEDVTENLRTIHSIPLVLDEHGDHGIPDQLVLRGEVFIPLDAFTEMNERRLEEGEDPFANPRNAAAGTIRQLDSSIVAKRPLDIFVYDIMSISGVEIDTQKEVYEALPEWGFKVNDRVEHSPEIEEVIDYRHEVAEARDGLNFEIDGVVIKVNEMDVREELGTRQANPRWAIAYKFEPRKEITTIERIGVQVGRTGKLTPVAFLQPVDVGGVTISRASLHNYDLVREKDIREGDRVRVERAGDVIPYVAERVEEDDEEVDRGRPFEMPEACPSCGSGVVVEGAYHMCSGGMHCPAQLQGHLEHFVSRDAMDIDGIGEEQIKQLREENLVETIADLYKLTKDELLEVDDFRNETYVSIRENTEHPELGYILQSVSPPGIGDKTVIQLANRFGSLEDLLDASIEQLEEAGFSGNKAETIHGNIHDPEWEEQLKEAAENSEQAEAAVGKSLFNFLEEREKSKETTLDRFLYALGIHHVGSHVATVIARDFETVEQLMEASRDELESIHEIGPEVAESVVHFFDDRGNRDIVKELLEAGVKPEPLDTDQASALEGLTFVFTGGLDEMTRGEAQDLVESLGARATSSVSGNTDYLVAGQNPGDTKMSDAEEEGTPVLDEEDLYELLENETDQTIDDLTEAV